MSKTLEITVGDTGITLSGIITHAQLKQLSSTSGMSVKVSCKRDGGGADLFTDRVGSLGTFSQANGTLAVSYRLVAGDVAVPSPGGRVVWALTLADGGVIHSPGPSGKQTILKINL